MKFISHIKSLKIVIKPAQPVFEGGVKVSDAPGKYALFVDGQFETEDQKIIDKLESLSTFGVDFWKESGEPEKKEPEVDGELEKLTKKELQALLTEKEISFDESDNKDRLIELLQEKK